MRLSRIQTLTAVSLSLAVHVAGAAIFIPPEATIEIAGGAATSQLIIGTAFEDSLMAGEPGEVLTPVETPPSDMEAVDPSEAGSVEPAATNTAEQVTEAAIQPTTSESLPVSTDVPDVAGPVPSDQAVAVEIAPAIAPAPSEPVQGESSAPTNAVPVIESMPAQSEELASLSPTSEIEPAAESEPQIALPENIPLPVARPEPPQTATATPPAPAPQKAKPAQSKPKKSDTNRKTERAASKPSQAGDGGKQHATASKSSSGSATAKRNTAAGNAAVSNYPGKIASQLRRALRYPRQAKRQGIRGDVVVAFFVASNGGISNVRISRSSGSPVLDGAAADAVRRAAPFPPIPSGAGRSSWSFSVPLGFTR